MTLDAQTVDGLVKQARSLVGEVEQLPDRSAVQTLANFSQSTTSFAELCLFVDYQGAKAPQQQRPFFRKVSSVLQSDDIGDLDRARRFLGLLVRAAVVQREHAARGRGGAQR
ncbi:hypothetical protein [Rhabdothermincola sediminis]|uniref:hypothetical protein n=1 Tax=Rhabdothermincola sediminis TaxID=2751370 RepID=UPI001AA06279|nr:hypothetical protein [Rhabdothermincola sediminis]